ncbi:unnamed protein product, partial [Brassica oleracea var. botrytis]
KEINGLEKIIIRDRQVTSFFVTKGQVTSWKNEKGEELLFMTSDVNGYSSYSL